jgi:hypothetical protein
MTKTSKGPAFLRFLEPVLETLKELGGSAKSGEVIDEVVKRLGLSEAELAEQTTSGQSRIRNQIGWARFYLKSDGFIQRSQRGRWTLTPKGATATLDEEVVQRVFKDVHERFKKLAEEEEGAAPLPDDEEELTRDDDSDDGELAGDEDEQQGGTELPAEPFEPAKIRIETRTMTIDLLVRRIQAGEINLLTDFQRAAGLWKPRAQSRLIESLLIRIPLPAFYMDATDDEKWLVVDGLQRLTVLKRFIIDQSFGLTELEFLTVHTNKKFGALPRPMQRRIEETQVTVNLIQPGTPSEVKFNIFKRINTGGLPLSGQEIRHALNQGPAATMLERLAALPEFQEVAGKSLKDERMTNRECVLRFLAFVLTPYSHYGSPDLDGFLNEQMKRLHGMTEQERNHLETRFVRAMVLAKQIFGDDAFRKRYRLSDARKPINKALFESWSVGLDALSDAERTRLIERREKLRERFIGLMNNPEFDASVSQGTGDTNKVRRRFGEVARIIRETLE